MRTITVNKSELLDRLVDNRGKHRDTFEKALEVFRQRAIDVFEAQIDAVRNGRMPEVYLNLPIPEEHTEDYDRAIQMLGWHTEDTVELTEGEFRQYVQDNWGWRQSFTANTTSYTS